MRGIGLKFIKVIPRYITISIFISSLLSVYFYYELFDQQTAALIRLRLVELGTFLSGVGTIAAVYVAFLALNNWKSQSKGEPALKRLLTCQEEVSILCCELLDRTSNVMGKEKEELYAVVKSLDSNLAILSRQVHPNGEILSMKQLLYMPKVRVRDCGVLWSAEKENLLTLEEKINKYIATR